MIDLIGEVPAGYEPVMYVISVSVFVILLLSALNVIGAVFKWIGGK